MAIITNVDYNNPQSKPKVTAANYMSAYEFAD